MTPLKARAPKPIVLDCRSDRRPHAPSWWVRAEHQGRALLLCVTAEHRSEAIMETHRVAGHEYVIADAWEGHPPLPDA